MQLSKFKEKLDNTPHLMTSQAFLNIAEFLNNPPNDLIMGLFDDEDDEDSGDSNNYSADTKVGTIFITGSLTYQTEWYQKYFGGNSYENIKAEAENLISKGAKTLLLWQDSGGGEAYNMFETANYLRKLADDNNVTILSYVDGMSASASYGLSSIADEIIANPQSEVGSIGVVVRLRNVNKAMKAAGVEDKYVYFGTNKIPYDANGEWSKDFIDNVQAKVDNLGAEFTEFVAGHRKLSVEAVKATNAATFTSSEAKAKGLIDSVMTHEEFYTYLADFVQKREKPMSIRSKLTNLNSEQDKIEMKELEAALAELNTIKTQMQADATINATLKTEVAEMTAQVATLSTQLSQFQDLAKTLQAEKDQAAQAAVNAKAESRKASLKDVLAETEVEGAFAALADASDAVFEFALSGYKKAEADKKKNDPLFKELGGEGADTSAEFDPVKAQEEFTKKYYANNK